MARTIVQQVPLATQSGIVWSLVVEQLSGVDHPGYAPLLPDPGESTFLGAYETVNGAPVQRGYERVGTADALVSRIAALTTYVQGLP